MKTRKLQSVGTALLLMLFLCTNLLWAENQEITRKKNTPNRLLPGRIIICF